MTLEKWPRHWTSHRVDDVQEQIVTEQIIATARVFLSCVALAAVYVDPSEPSLLAPVAHALLLSYAAYSLAVLVIIWRFRPGWAPGIGLWLFVADVVLACVVSLLTEGPSSPFFVFFVFVLLSSAYRWGIRETVAAGILASLVLTLQAAVVANQTWYAPVRFELNRLIIRGAYLVLVAVLVGYLAEKEKRLRGRTLILARLLSVVRVGRGFRMSLQAVLQHLIELVGARRALVVLERTDSGRLYLVTVRMLGAGTSSRAIVRRVAADDRARYLFEVQAPVECWEIARRPNGRPAVVAVSGAGETTDGAALMTTVMEADGPWDELIGIDLDLSLEWRGRLFLVDSERDRGGAPRLKFLREIVHHVGPALYSLYLLQLLRAKAGTLARSEVARELHQGVIQSLVGIEMQLHALSHDTGRLPKDVQASLAGIHGRIQNEILDVRDLMYKLQPPPVGPRQLPQFLENLVERFDQASGIRARFVLADEAITLPAGVCREVAGIVREALSNIRRHSGARSVTVRLDAKRVSIADDGRGFLFEGRLTLEELSRRGIGPTAIMEGVRAMGGALVLESAPGGGARIEVVFPRTAA